jgi:putative transposase
LLNKSRKGQACEKKCQNTTPKLDDAEVLRRAEATLEKYFPLQADGYCCKTQTLYQVLIGLGVKKSTIQSICAELSQAPDGETVRGYLNQQLNIDQLSRLEQQLNAALAANWPKKLRRAGSIPVAMDFHDRPYYGKSEQSKGLWVRGETKGGTTHFYRVATAYAMVSGQRVTLAIHFVLPKQETVEVLGALWHRLRQHAIRISCLFLDKGFASVEVYQYLDKRQQPALIACPIRGKQGGTRALCQGNKSYQAEHTFHSGKRQLFTAQVSVCRVFTTAKRTGRHKREARWLLFVRIHLNWTPTQCRQRYRKRFGIETSYRLTNKLLGWTTSPNPALRFVLMGLGFVLLNLWVELCWEFTQVARRGGRTLKADLFRQQRFINFLIRALEHIYGYVSEITAPSPPLL